MQRAQWARRHDHVFGDRDDRPDFRECQHRFHGPRLYPDHGHGRSVDGSLIAIYGTNVNDTGATWTQFTATIVSGTEVFQDPNDPYSGYGTYTDTPNWSVSLTNNDQTAVFSGGLISAGNSLDTFLGITVTGSQPFTIQLTPSSVPEPASVVLTGIGLVVLMGGFWGRHWFGETRWQL